MKKEVYIIGAGPGKTSELTKEAIRLIKDCKEVYSFERIASLNSDLRVDIRVCTYGEIINRVNQSTAKSIALLVSGDIGFFSIAKTLIPKLEENCSVKTVCGISSMQYFCSKIGVSYENINVVSLHGRSKSILGNVSYNNHVFVLTDGVNRADKICIQLCENMLFDIKVYVGENLSMENERIFEGTAYEGSKQRFDQLSVLIIENQSYADKNIPLFDEDFTRDDAPMTKEEVRWSSVNNLKIKSGDIVFDIGAGTGSVAIEMARKAYEGIVYAIEKNNDTFHLLKENIVKLRAFNVIPISGEASEEIKKLPIPDKAFIGGSGGNLKEIIKYLYTINPNIRMVVNAITLETLVTATEVFNDMKFKTKTVCINCAKNRPVGNYNMMIANNPVYIITGEKYEE
ncbi:UNVERIFIED_CONTAM: precorrin-6Y C5,15-methyltransferase (decarboxylating) [Acetivibrio alkalicellulosi]